MIRNNLGGEPMFSTIWTRSDRLVMEVIIKRSLWQEAALLRFLCNIQRVLCSQKNNKVSRKNMREKWTLFTIATCKLQTPTTMGTTTTLCITATHCKASHTWCFQVYLAVCLLCFAACLCWLAAAAVATNWCNKSTVIICNGSSNDVVVGQFLMS